MELEEVTANENRSTPSPVAQEDVFHIDGKNTSLRKRKNNINGEKEQLLTSDTEKSQDEIDGNKEQENSSLNMQSDQGLNTNEPKRSKRVRRSRQDIEQDWLCY